MLSFSEISLHNKPQDCWVIVNAKAYDVTNFLTDHPGGEDVLLAATGKDGSEEFEKAGHGSASRLMLDEFYVGEVDPLTMPTKTTSIHYYSLSTEQKPTQDSCFSKALFFALPLIILLFAIGIKIMCTNYLD